MSSDNPGNGKAMSIAIALFIMGMLFLYLKKSGQLDEIKRALNTVSGQAHDD